MYTRQRLNMSINEQFFFIQMDLTILRKSYNVFRTCKVLPYCHWTSYGIL